MQRTWVSPTMADVCQIKEQRKQAERGWFKEKGSGPKVDRTMSVAPSLFIISTVSFFIRLYKLT